jgi:hypothetical protein
VSQDSPSERQSREQGSDFFKLLTKFRESCTNAAQVKEILKIRTDKVARQRVIDNIQYFGRFHAVG